MAKKNYELVKDGKKHTFTGNVPRAAALKAATRGFTDIRLRECGRKNKDGTYSIHVFRGSCEMVDAPANRPSWLPAKVKKPIVSKVGVERVKEIPR